MAILHHSLEYIISTVVGWSFENCYLWPRYCLHCWLLILVKRYFKKNKAFLNLSSINLPYTDIVSCEGGFFSFPEAACISRLAR